MTNPTPPNLDRTAEIRARVGAATSEQPGPWTVNLWPADEHDCGAEGEVINAAGNAALSLLGSAAYVALGANAPADLAFLLEENERLRDEAALASGAADMHAEYAADTDRLLASAGHMLADRDDLMREWVRRQDVGEPLDPRGDIVAENAELRREVARFRALEATA